MVRPDFQVPAQLPASGDAHQSTGGKLELAGPARPQKRHQGKTTRMQEGGRPSTQQMTPHSGAPRFPGASAAFCQRRRPSSELSGQTRVGGASPTPKAASWQDNKDARRWRPSAQILFINFFSCFFFKFPHHSRICIPSPCISHEFCREMKYVF